MACSLSLAFACGIKAFAQRAVCRFREWAPTQPPSSPEKVPVESDRIRGLQYGSKTPILLQSAQNEVAA